MAAFLCLVLLSRNRALWLLIKSVFWSPFFLSFSFSASLSYTLFPQRLAPQLFIHFFSSSSSSSISLTPRLFYCHLTHLFCCHFSLTLPRAFLVPLPRSLSHFLPSRLLLPSHFPLLLSYLSLPSSTSSSCSSLLLDHPLALQEVVRLTSKIEEMACVMAMAVSRDVMAEAELQATLEQLDEENKALRSKVFGGAA